MCKIQFDEKGNAKPYGLTKLTYEECREYFVDAFPDSETRDKNWEQFLEFHKDIEDVSKFSVKHWIDGSFVTNKLSPKDIDVVSFVRPENLTLALQQFDMNKSDPKGYVKNKYNIDNYIVVDCSSSHPYYGKMKQQREYWLKFFSTDRNDDPKSLIEVE